MYLFSKIMFKLKMMFLNPKKRAAYLKKKGTVKLGEECQIYRNVSFGSEPYLIELGNRVRIAPHVQFVTHDGGMWVLRNLGWRPQGDKMGRIKVGDNVFIGIRTIVLPDVTIGSNVIIGAGSVITKDIPDNVVAAGVPARVICSIEEFYIKNEHKIHDTNNMPPHEKKRYYQELL